MHLRSKTQHNNIIHNLKDIMYNHTYDNNNEKVLAMFSEINKHISFLINYWYYNTNNNLSFKQVELEYDFYKTIIPKCNQLLNELKQHTNDNTKLNKIITSCKYKIIKVFKQLLKTKLNKHLHTNHIKLFESQIVL